MARLQAPFRYQYSVQILDQTMKSLSTPLQESESEEHRARDHNGNHQLLSYAKFQHQFTHNQQQ